MACEDLEWWKKTVVYQVYPRSFQDSNGDGIGDLKGIQSRLDYFEYLGIGAVWLSPIYRSPMKDFGYDISDFTDIDPIFGSLEDFDDLIADMHKRGLKLIMDYIPNHSSDQHRWFQESRKGGTDNPFSDYYIWMDGRKTSTGEIGPPNNWLSNFGGSAWSWDETRRQYYLHQFAKEQPDLNWRNPCVVKDMENVLRFWLNRGVDGFRVDAIDTLYETNFTQDEPRDMNAKDVLEMDHKYLDHIYTRNQPEIQDIIKSWRKLFDEYKEKENREIFFVVEIYDITLKYTMEYYESGACMPFNFNLVEIITKDSGGNEVFKVVHDWMTKMPKGKWPNFVLGNHDNKRITTRKGTQYADVMNVLLLTLPGTPTTYQGEELALRDIEVTYEDTVDPYGKNFGPEHYTLYSRDCCRGPMQWDNSHNAGFTTAHKAWLPPNPDYKTRNVQSQKCSSSDQESITIYRRAVNLRNLPEFQNTNIKYAVVNNNIFSFVRSQTSGSMAYLVAVNVGQRKSSDVYKLEEFNFEDASVEMVIGKDNDLKESQMIDLKQEITLKPGEGVVIKLRLM